MRVLLLHNRYRAQGGEERAVADLQVLLRERGHDVELLERSSAAAGRVGAATALARGGEDPDQVRDAVRRLDADVVHAHNLHPLFGWRALAAARSAGARTVVHLHNFRLFCAISIAYRDGAACFRCRGRNTLPGLRLRCRGSLPEAAAYAFGLHRQQPHLVAQADVLVAVSAATAQRLVGLGLPAAQTRSVPNFVPAAGFAGRSEAAAGEYALVSGRLVEEKGFDTAIEAARAAGVPLVVAGEGPDAPRLRSLAHAADVRFTGRLAAGALAELRRGAGAVLVPSRWEEPCPYSALDALAAGVPVLASDQGGLPELVGDEAVLPADQPRRWREALEALWSDPAARAERGAQALERARARFSEQAYYDRLMEIYSG
ncbi:MAG TPA: glycosyltransferase family 4 protein [Solirubrobacteraceae bacterium]|jgi:glycosyltransferase involved in cell wall biosynthesis